MTSSEIRQRLYIAMQEKNEYYKAFEIIKVFNESYKDTKEENKFALGIRDELKKLYYQWGLAVKELNRETGWIFLKIFSYFLSGSYLSQM